MRCGSPAPTISAMLGVFCAFMFPNVFAMALFVVIQLSYWAFIVATILAVAKATYIAYLCAKVLFHIGQYVYYSALVKVQRATYHHSSPESVNDDVKPQTLDITTLLKDLENALWSTKHIAASNLIATCATARTKTAKIAALFGLWQLYSCQPPSDTVNDFIMENYQHCVDAVTWISEYIEKRDLTGEFTRIKDKYLGNKSESNDEVVEQSNDEVTTLTEFIRSHTAKEGENGASARWIAQNKGLVATACTVAAFIMSSVAMSSLVGGDKQHTLASKLIEYGRLITAKKIIGGQVQEMTEGLLSLIYACIGQTYVPPGEEQIAAVQEEILNISKKLQEIETQVSSDFFGLMRSNHLALVDDQMKNVEKMYKDLSQLQKSQYNLTTLMQSIRTGYEALVQKQRDLIANATGKQEPIVIAFVGDPGHGKTELMRQTVKFLEDKYQVQTYFRNVNEEYWSNFCGQQILVWDDMGLTKEGKEYSEFSYHTQGAPSSVVGAAISDKGKRTNPLFILTTSNHCYLGPQGHNMATPDAYHRRRNIVIRVENSKAAEYMATHGTTIPSHLFDESKTTLTLMRSVPLNGNIEIQANVLGATNIERIHASLVEFEKNACNRFKQALRVKPYYKGNIPADEVVNTEMCTEKYLTTGKFTPANAPDTMSQESDVFEQAINPVTISTTRKHPFVLISGPSGAGKTHFARTIVQNFNPNLDPIITSTGFPVLESGKAYIVDDITLSPERYSDSITWLNQVYEEGTPAIVVVTENADKTHNVDQSIVAEIHRRAHVFSLRWRYGWTECFQPPKYFALKHKKDIGELGAIPAQTKNLVLRATEYSKEQEDLNVSSCVSYAVQLAGNKYGDDILQEEEWTLPMPKDIDFTVHLRKNFSEMRDETPATLMKAVLTGSLFSVTNITGRFSHLGLITGLKTLFAQAPNFGTNCIRETVTSFNRAQVESKFSEKGTALLTTPEGSVGVRWDTRNVRMFSVSENHDLAQKGIDVMSYFNPNVANVYKDLIEGVVFSEKTVQEIEQLIQSQREESFKEKSIISVLFRSTAVLVSLAAQIIAPLALFRESVNQLNDRNELNYFRACNRYEQKLKMPTQHAPKIKIGTTEIAIHDFEKALGTRMVNEEDAIHILEANPHAVQHVNHSTTHFTNIRSVLKQNIGIETYPSIRTLEARTSQPSTIDTYGNGSPRQLKKPNENVELEAFNSRAEYDAWVARTYGADSFDGERAEWAITMDADADWERIHEDYELYHTVDDAPIERIAPHEAEEYVCHGKSWADEDWGIDDESSPEPKKKKLVKKITIESSPEPGKTKKRMVIHVQSSPEPKKKKKTEQVHMQSVKIQFGTEDDIGKYRKFDVQKGYELYTFMEKDGYVCCQGKRPEIRNVVRQYSIAARYKWAVYMVSDDATPQEIINKIGLVKPEVAESELKHGDIIKIRRTMAGVPYVHFGVIGPSPLEEGKTVLYHVQPMNNGGASSAVIAVDDLAILNLAEWEIHHPDTMCHKEEGFRCIRKYREFGHLKQHAYNTFAYNGFTSNCETWALSMVYDTQSVNVFKRQQIPEYFIPLLEIVKTFKTVEPEFVGQIEEMVAVEQSCLDSTALRISRETLPPAQVLLCDPQTRITVTRALGIKGKYMLTVGHVKQTRLLVKRMTPEGVKFFEAKRVLVDANMDLSIWEADKQMPAFKDNTKLFMSKAEIKDALAIGTSQVATVGIANIADNAVTINNYTVRIKGQIDQTTDFTKRLGSHGLEYTAVLMGATSESAFTAEGDCGSPLMIYSATAPRKLIGIHRAGSTTKMYAALVPAEWLTYAFSRIVNTQSATVLPGVEMLDEPVLDPMTGLKLVGYSKYPTGPPMGTKIRKVDIEFDAIKTEYEPAILSGKDPRAPGYNPAIKTLTKFCRDVPRLNEREIQEAEKDLIEELKVRLMGKTLKVFTTLASINGPPVSEYPNAGALNRKTGVGWPNNVRDHVTDKQAYLDYCDVDGTELWKIKRSEVGNRLRDDISTLLGVCAAGKRPGVVFSYFPKDEVLKKKKIDDPNTRGILAGTFPYVIAYRRYYLALHLRIQEIFHKIPIKIGIDPHSMDWHELAVYHHEVGDKGFDADAKNWDASIPRRLMESVPVIVNALYQELDPNWRQEDDTIRSALHMAVEAPYILYDNKIVQAPGGQVSGQPGTAFDNSLINWMLCLIIFKRAMRADGKPHLATNKAFNELCRLSVYGDDMMLTVAPEASAMTMEHYIHEAATFGIEITPADKDAGATNTHIHISKMSFLKRNFNQIGKVWVGPIDRNSIAKAILWLRGSGTYIPSMDPTTGRISWPVSQETTVLRQNFTGQLTECALHGRELFENVRRQLNENLLRLGMDVITTTYVDELVNLGIMRA